ncbi:MAG: RHS repeat-associated core domain-containing protein [Blastocatellales bacterium]|nr:RHS repeat-associated core domain-containing protein [Blastocatellales bacterium]
MASSCGIGGGLVAEYRIVGGAPTLKEYGYRNGELLVVWDGDEAGDKRWQWRVTDQLGTARMLVDLSGSFGAIKRRDYLPFGEEILAGVGHRTIGNGYPGMLAANPRQHFTGYERDSETGLDFAQARYYANIQGRFTSVDPLLASAELDEPQSWNRYSYTLNNPLKYTDLTGEKWAVQYENGQATFRWYDGDKIPTDWEGKWEEYKAGWFIGTNEAIRLGSRGSNDVLILTKDLFSNEDWAKLQGTNPANLTPEQKEILFSGATYRIDQTEFGRRWKAMAEAGAYVSGPV